jgi:hypothetical protein
MTLSDIAGEYSLTVPTVRTYNGKAAHNRRQGTAKPHDFPAPVDRIGNSPLFDAREVRDWFDHRPGRGAGGGRPRIPRTRDQRRTSPDMNTPNR